ncbi:MAG: hypothetical protein AAF563_14300 [Pseudomonadota bacterium]
MEDLKGKRFLIIRIAWRISSAFLLAIGLVSLTQRLYLIDWSEWFLQIADVYRDIVYPPFRWLYYILGVDIPDYVSDVIVVYFLFGGGICTILIYHNLMGGRKGETRFARVVWRLAYVVWPIIVLAAIFGPFLLPLVELIKNGQRGEMAKKYWNLRMLVRLPIGMMLILIVAGLLQASVFLVALAYNYFI